MLQNAHKTLGFKKNLVFKISPGGGGGKPYPASGLFSKKTDLPLEILKKYLLLSNQLNKEV